MAVSFGRPAVRTGGGGGEQKTMKVEKKGDKKVIKGVETIF